MRRALHGGIVHYLMKPFAYEDLRSRLEHYATAHRSLAAVSTTDQAQVDQILGTGNMSHKATPKGLSPETADAVERTLRGVKEPMSAAECANLVAISRVSARRYLEHYVASGKVSVSLRYGAAGRPAGATLRVAAGMNLAAVVPDKAERICWELPAPILIE